MIRLTIPWACLCSDNKRNVRRGGRGHGWEYKQARENIRLIGMGQYRDAPLMDKAWVRMDFYPPNARRRDASNMIKVIFDGLIGVAWLDDSLLRDVGYLVHPPDGSEPRVEIRAGQGRHQE